MSEWYTETLGQLADAAGGAIRTGPFGSQLHRHEYVHDGEVAVVMPRDMIDGRIAVDSIARIDRETANRLAEHLLQPSDIVLARRGDVGRAAWVDASDGAVLCGTGSMRIHLPGGKVMPRYLHYVLQAGDAVDWLQAQAVGATMPNLNADIVRGLPVRYPDLPTQRSIVEILDSADDLIESNWRRSTLLEKMAQTIYREWFVRLRYPGHERDKRIASSLGVVPDGWEIATFSELGDFMNGFAFKPAHWGDVGLPIVKIKELKSGVSASTPRYNGTAVPLKYRVEDGDLLFSWSAHLDAYLWSGGSAWLNQHLFKVGPARGIAKSWLFLTIREHIDEFRARSQGTTMKHIKRAALKEVVAATPPPELMRAFAGVVDPILGHGIVLSRVRRSLAEIRDLLLPKLVSGALDVSQLDLDALLQGSTV